MDVKVARAEMAHASAQNERKTDTEIVFTAYHPPSFSTFYTYKSSKKRGGDIGKTAIFKLKNAYSARNLRKGR